MSKKIKVLSCSIVNGAVFVANRYLDGNEGSKRLQEMYDLINCNVVTCTQIEVSGNYYDVWSDDEALLVENPKPILYINDDLVIFGNGILFSKSNDYGEMESLTDNDILLLEVYFSRQYKELIRWLKRIDKISQKRGKSK